MASLLGICLTLEQIKICFYLKEKNIFQYTRKRGNILKKQGCQIEKILNISKIFNFKYNYMKLLY